MQKARTNDVLDSARHFLSPKFPPISEISSFSTATPDNSSYLQTAPITKDFFQLLQLRVLRLGFLQDGDVGVGVFPEREEFLILDAGLRGITRGEIRSAQLQMY